MSINDDSGPAFARPDGETNYAQDGMTLRQWYAGQALAGVLPIQDSAKDPEAIAALCFRIADAMVEAGRY